MGNIFKKFKNIFPNPLVKIRKTKMLFIFLLLIILFTSPFLIFELYFYNRTYPNISVASYDVGGMKKEQAKGYLSANINLPAKMILMIKDKTFELSLNDIGFYYDFDKTIDKAFQVYRTEPFYESYPDKYLTFVNKVNVKPVISYDNIKLEEYINVVAQEVAVEPIYPKVTLVKGVVMVDPGKSGESIDKEKFKNTFEKKSTAFDFTSIDLPLKFSDTTLNGKRAEEFRVRAEKLIDKSIILKYNDDIIGEVKNDTILNYLDPFKLYNHNNIIESINKDVATKIDREPQNAVFRFTDNKVNEFVPAKDGIRVIEQTLLENILSSLDKLENSDETSSTIDVPVETMPPKITTAEVNDLGIKELLGRGVSKFAGSIPGRIHNISLASSKFVGILVPPGEVFSFNDTLGDVSVFTGYKQAYIIRDGKTVLGDGGGVCQVSTTLFRALLDAGFPIVERRAHSYRVGYYEQGSPVGLDATVFSPTTDLKFKNDSPANILIQTEFDAKNTTLIFEIYGTSDGRVATTTKPVIVSSSAPPEDLYIDDPTLPTGTIKQIDYKAWGAKVVFDQKVERNGEVIYQNTFVSNYRPWQAKFLRGTGYQPVN